MLFVTHYLECAVCNWSDGCLECPIITAGVYVGTKLPERQIWLENALHGLAFWIGHRHSLFRDYPLAEGALVAEACNLIQANLPHTLVLLPECLYKNLALSGSAVPGIGVKARADLVLCDAEAKGIGREGRVAAHTRFVVEVKRGDASAQAINDDLRRLHSFLGLSAPGTRCFLLVVSESRAPKRFVRDGKSRLGAHKIEKSTGKFHVRRSVKAAASFSGRESAHYVCLVEVFQQGQELSQI